MSCLREVQTISKSPHILPMPSLTRPTTGGILNPLKNTTNTSHNELFHQDPLQPPLEPGELTEETVEQLTVPADLADYRGAIAEALQRGTRRVIATEPDPITKGEAKAG